MRNKQIDLITIAVSAAIATVLIVVGVEHPVSKLIVSLPLVFVYPGYALTAMLFRRTTLGVVERLALSFGLSITITIIGGFIIDKTVWGLQATSWAIWLGGITVGCSCVALVLRHEYALERTPTWPVIRSYVRYGWPLALAAVVVIISIGLARDKASTQPYPGFTQLWLVPYDNGPANAIRLGVYNQEGAPEQYHLRVEADGRQLLDWPMIQLNPGETWENVANLAIDRRSTAIIEAKLYRLDSPDTVYRYVTLKRAVSAK
jgi:uncharacterized membrane protein